MNASSQPLLVGAVAAVGVLHTVVPDHWVPITVLARQRGWSRPETARAALQAGSGHVLSTLAVALLVWLAGAALAARFGAVVDTASSLALIGFGLWFAFSSWHELHHGHAHPPRPHAGYEGHSPGRPAAMASGTVHERTTRTALLLILGSSPMVEGIPAFFAAARYGAGLIVGMAVVFAGSTIATYVLLCVSSSAGLQRVRWGALERYGEVLSGATVAVVGLATWLWPLK